MALKPGRVGVDPSQVDLFGNIIGGGSGGDIYTKAEADAKFETQTAAAQLQPITLAVPIEMLSGTKLTVESALQGLNSEKFTYADNGVLGAKNLFVNPYYDGTSKASNGVTFTVNSDGSITVDTNGSPSTGETSFRLMRYDRDQGVLNRLNGKSLIKSGTNGDVVVQGYWGGATHREDNITVDVISMTNWNFAVYVASGKIVDNVTVYPMLRLASDPDTTYQPYAMTNKELTDSLDGWSSASQVQSDNTVTFTGLNDNYAYDLYCENRLIGVSSITKTGSGNNITLVYTVTGAAPGNSCKLRVIK